MTPGSAKPYLLRALYEWCVDQGFTPHVLVIPDQRTVVPNQYVRDGQIVLNVGPLAVQHLVMNNDEVSFAARFGGVAFNVFVPMDRIAAIYARENGDGMAFPVSEPAAEAEVPDETGKQPEEVKSPAPEAGANLSIIDVSR